MKTLFNCLMLFTRHNNVCALHLHAADHATIQIFKFTSISSKTPFTLQNTTRTAHTSKYTEPHRIIKPGCLLNGRAKTMCRFSLTCKTLYEETHYFEHFSDKQVFIRLRKRYKSIFFIYECFTYVMYMKKPNSCF